MDNRFLGNVINEIKPFFDENGFSEYENGYKNDVKAVNVNYDEARQMFVLSIADIDENSTIGEFSEVNAWLFDDTQNAKDAISVGIDFTSTLRKELGIKHKRVTTSNEIELPSASKSGNMTVAGFTKKMLDIFPPLKAEYKNHIAQYGNFLYLNFFGEFLVADFKKVYLTGTTKQIKKFTDVLKDAYVKGDSETVNAVIVLLCAASYKDDAVKSAIQSALADDKHFLSSYENFLPVFVKNKKLVSTLIK